MPGCRWPLSLVLVAACSGIDGQAVGQTAPVAEQESGSAAGQAAAVGGSVAAQKALAGNDGGGTAGTPAPTAETVPWPEDAPPAFKALFAGSWTCPDAESFDRQWIDEARLVETYTHRRAGRRLWRGLRSTDGVMPLDLLIRDRTGPAVAYVYVLSYRRPADPGRAPQDVVYADAPAVLHLRHRGRARVLFDGEVVLDLQAPPPGEILEAQGAVTLTDGFDVVLVKVGRGSAELGTSMEFELRLSDPLGAPIPMQGWNTMRTSEIPSELGDRPDDSIDGVIDETTDEAPAEPSAETSAGPMGGQGADGR